MLWKVVYPFEYIDDWGKFIERSLHEKEEIYIKLNTEDITDTDTKYAKIRWKEFEIKNLGEYHDL